MSSSAPNSGAPQTGAPSETEPWMGARGLLLAVAAPSGAGKTTLCMRMAQRFATLRYGISYTTRNPRDGEVDGEHYHFVDRTEFQRMVGEGAFLEWAEVHGNFYGTPRTEVEALLESGHDVLLDMDVQGVESLRASGLPGLYCLILPPSYAILRERLLTRGKDSMDEIERRLTIAVKESARVNLFDYVVVNDDLDEATRTLESIIRAAHVRRECINETWFRDTFIR